MLEVIISNKKKALKYINLRTVKYKLNLFIITIQNQNKIILRVF